MPSCILPMSAGPISEKKIYMKPSLITRTGKEDLEKPVNRSDQLSNKGNLTYGLFSLYDHPTYFFNKHFQYFPLICRQKSQFTVQATDVDCSRENPSEYFQ